MLNITNVLKTHEENKEKEKKELVKRKKRKVYLAVGTLVFNIFFFIFLLIFIKNWMAIQ